MLPKAVAGLVIGDVIVAAGGITSAISGVVAIAGLYTYIVVIPRKEESLRKGIVGEGIVNPDTIIKVLKQFKGDAERLAALRAMLNYDAKSGKEVLEKIKKFDPTVAQVAAGKQRASALTKVGSTTLCLALIVTVANRVNQRVSSDPIGIEAEDAGRTPGHSGGTGGAINGVGGTGGSAAGAAGTHNKPPGEDPPKGEFMTLDGTVVWRGQSNVFPVKGVIKCTTYDVEQPAQRLRFVTDASGRFSIGYQSPIRCSPEDVWITGDLGPHVFQARIISTRPDNLTFELLDWAKTPSGDAAPAEPTPAPSAQP